MNDFTVHIVDDDQGVRRSLEVLLRSEKFLVRTYSSAETFLREFDSRIPGCLILDIRMPGMTGLELQEILTKENVLLPTIIISAHGSVAAAVKAIKLGSFDFLEKPFSTDELLMLVRKAIAHVDEKRDEHEWRINLRNQLERLTPREHEILISVVAGKPSKQIASDFGLSVSTVDNHRAKIMKKLKAETTADLARIVLSANPELARTIA